MWLFKRRPKINRHKLAHVTDIPQNREFYRAVKCSNCGKQFVMDVFGGWAVEWKFELDKNVSWLVDQQNFADGIKHFHSTRQTEWVQLGSTDICEGEGKEDKP